MRYVGTRQYAALLEAREYYEGHGYQFVDVPWAVGREAILLTRPPAITGEPFSYLVDHERAGKWLDANPGTRLYPVASAEQSFLQMQMDATAAGKPITGNWCAITPCFRNEAKLDDLHQPYFIKLELIRWLGASSTLEMHDLQHMIAVARNFFGSMYEDSFDGEHLQLETVANRELFETDPLNVGLPYDIETVRGGIELGSYGIREHKSVGKWIYGTGLAEPRYTYAVEADRALRVAAARPS